MSVNNSALEHKVKKKYKNKNKKTRHEKNISSRGSIEESNNSDVTNTFNKIPLSLLSFNSDNNNLISDFRDISSEESSPLPSITAQTPEFLKHRQRLENNLIEDDRPVWTQIPCINAIIESINDDLSVNKFKEQLVLNKSLAENNIQNSNTVLPILTHDIIDFNHEVTITKNNLTTDKQSTNIQLNVNNDQQSTNIPLHVDDDQQSTNIPLHINNDQQSTNIPLHINNESLFGSKDEETDSDFFCTSSELDAVDKKYSSMWRASRFLKYSNFNMNQNYIELIEYLFIRFRARSLFSFQNFGLINDFVAMFSIKGVKAGNLQCISSTTTHAKNILNINCFGLLSIVWSVIIIFNSLLYSIFYFILSKLISTSIRIFKSYLSMLILLWLGIQKLVSVLIKKKTLH